MGLCGVNSGHEENEEGAGHEYNHTIEYRDNSSSWQEKEEKFSLKNKHH